MATQKAKIKTRPWDPAKSIKDDEEAAVYLEVTLAAASEDGYFKAVGEVVWDIVRYKGAEKVAHDVGMNTEGLKTALTGDGHGDLSLIMQVLRALGLQLHASVAETKSDG